MFAVEFRDGAVVEWHRTDDGATATRVEGYRPELYVTAGDDALETLRDALDADPKVDATEFVERRTSLHEREPERVLRVACRRVDEVRTLARGIRERYERGSYAPGSFRLFNVDLSPGFRYCLETGTSPVPDADLSALSLRVDRERLANGDLTRLEIDGEPVAGALDAVLRTVRARVERDDPDVLVVDDARLVPRLHEAAEREGVEFDLGRAPGFERLAGANTFGNDGRVGHSPARFSVPGRAILDTANSFLWNRTDLSGLLYLVERSQKPIQEVGWASIGTVLTAIQVREAFERGVLVPWNKWEPEAWKDVSTLHAADRGGFTFQPQVGLHEDVYEVDFASLYPTVIRRYNVSPETVGCDCHADREDVPGLGYSICDRPGFLPDVLGPLLDDRAEIKRALENDAVDDPEHAASLRAQSAAIKWVLVSCFGYQGYRNAKFGRIECHEAINAYAREILLDARNAFEAGGWEVVHGIVDSLWVRRADADATPIVDVTAAVSRDVDISLEVENRYDWVCFVPRRDAAGGALTKYFGKVAEADEFKLRGIEARQRHTPTFVREAQREFLAALDRHREPAPVVDRLKRRLGRLRAGTVPPADLFVRRRVSKRPGEYDRRTHAAAALVRAREQGVEIHPGEDVRYVVVDDDARWRERVRLDFEDAPGYDADFYARLLVRACESVVSPLGWDRTDVRRYLRDVEELTLSAFEGSDNARE